MKDFFISYNSADKAWAEWIAWQLEEAGHTTIIQAWDFRPGRNFVLDMQQAAKEAERTIAVLSQNYLDAQYTQPEWSAAFARDPTGAKGILLPVRIQDCDLSDGMLSQIVYIDLVGLPPGEAKERLLGGLEQGRVKPASAPSFPGMVSSPAPATPQQPSFPGESSASESSQLDSQFEAVQISPDPPDNERKLFDPDDLESPEGVVDLESPFYIERRGDKRFTRELLKAGTTTTVIGARQMGKTSLLVRGVQAAREENFSIIFFDFQMVDTSQLQELDNFLRYLALDIATQVGVSPDIVESVWQIPLSPKDRLTRFLEDYVLNNTDQSIVLAIDEADRLAESNFRREFFSLTRAWHTLRGYNPLWKKLNVAMVISTQPYLLINDVNQSPFNVGTQIRLKGFTLEQVKDLNARHGQPLSEAELAEMMTLLGGLPYLVRKAFYALIDEEMTWPELAAIAIQRDGPFDAHLRQYRKRLQDPKLIEAIKSILKTQTSTDEISVNRLISAGLIEQKGSRYEFHCQLYDQYFRGVFL